MKGNDQASDKKYIYIFEKYVQYKCTQQCIVNGHIDKPENLHTV